MAKGKNAKKTVVSDKKVQPHYPVVTSDVCEKCSTKCELGNKYLGRMTVARENGDSFVGKGVVCKHGGK